MGRAFQSMSAKEPHSEEGPAGEPDSVDKGVDSLESGTLDSGEVEDIQEQAEKAEAAQPQKFGTFAGVFTPTLLTILGVIMYLREGWVVGNAGLGGAFLIILLSFGITMVSTALAFKVQYVILAIIVASLVSIGIAAFRGPMDQPATWWGDFRGSPEDGFGGTSF